MKILAAWYTWTYLHSPKPFRPYLQASSEQLAISKMLKKALLVFLGVCIQFLLDLLSVDLIFVKISSEPTNYLNKSNYYVCGDRSYKFLIFKDFFDFVTLFIVPVCFFGKAICLSIGLSKKAITSNQLRNARKYNRLIFRIIFSAIFFIVFNFPYSIVPIIANSLLFFSSYWSSTIEICLYTSYLVYFFRNVMSLFIYFYYNKYNYLEELN